MRVVKRDCQISHQKSHKTLDDIRKTHVNHKDNLRELGVVCAIVALLNMSEVIGNHNSINPMFVVVLGVILIIGWYKTRTRISYLTERIHNRKRGIK